MAERSEREDRMVIVNLGKRETRIVALAIAAYFGKAAWTSDEVVDLAGKFVTFIEGGR